MSPRLLVFIPAYNASSTIEWVLGRLPAELSEHYDLHVLVIDDASTDDTADRARAYFQHTEPAYSYTVLRTTDNRGYGGNQKLGYTFAIEQGFDMVVMVHGDGQYPPEAIEQLVTPLEKPDVGASFGSRFLRPDGPRDGGMPLYKRLANRMPTRAQNRLLATDLSEFHSGFRAYSVSTLERIPFHLNSDNFHFDTEIIIQLARLGIDITEIDIPTYYGDEVCYVNGPAYGLNVLLQTLRAWIHDRGILYHAKYGQAQDSPVVRYQAKTDFRSPTTVAAALIEDGERVLDLGAGAGGLADLLWHKCSVYGIDVVEPRNVERFERFWVHDLNASSPFPDDLPPVDTIVLLDVIEHLSDPESFVADLAAYCSRVGTVRRIVASTGNVGFALIRATLLFGQFNYGDRGILDRTHTRLFTFGSFRRLFRQAGFGIVHSVGLPAPFPLAVKTDKLARSALTFNEALIRISQRLFAYQVFLELEPPVGQSTILATTVRESSEAPVQPASG